MKRNSDKFDVVIMAGGMGTRVAENFPLIPKPMILINEIPVLEHQIKVLADSGFKNILIVVGHLHSVITSYFDSGEKWGVKIEYFVEETPLGTAGALYKVKDSLSENFILLNGDLIFDMNLERLYRFHMDSKRLATITVHPNSHPFDSAIVVKKGTEVVKWLSKNDPSRTDDEYWYSNCVNAGIHVLNKSIFDNIPTKDKVNLDRDILKPLIESGNLSAYSTTEYVKDMGTLERIPEVEREITSGFVHGKNLTLQQKAIFIDRDGVVNRHVGHLSNINDFELIKGVEDAISTLNNLGYLCIIVTNQPVIARGELSVNQLEMIHNKMETLLGNHGAYLDGIYYCPHHPDSGFEGEISELKFDCDCRKPKPGLLLAAKEEFNIDFSRSWMVGDHIRDIQAGNSVGCKTAFIGENELSEANLTFKSLLSFSEFLTSRERN
ncbi:D-glycero-beta-D-manno-heptose 1,7-bisphosphate 7-phosphatase [Erysipelothrix anatis]|uniref:D-glycero-beta-D-manno-heptose 1,7-bisphosphate 7-phosphatase n=1 Tax=Erysipelothrix anatis TaxID=2683713 RepID=UPI001916B6F4|nr:D-glycero-beta-D-manno-heptose 1,7-bisphosphate 7-phosphatase [Erysipelothrix anatis]